jgi:hypothetical protein
MAALIAKLGWLSLNAGIGCGRYVTSGTVARENALAVQ